MTVLVSSAGLHLTASLLREAARALARSKLRSALTAVGITIGIAAVVCDVAIGRAGAVRSEEQLSALGTNLVWIEEGSSAPNGVRSGSRSYALGQALDWPMAIPTQAIVVAPAFATADGVVFGFYPARKAAQLDPIEALRHE